MEGNKVHNPHKFEKAKIEFRVSLSVAVFCFPIPREETGDGCTQTILPLSVKSQREARNGKMFGTSSVNVLTFGHSISHSFFKGRRQKIEVLDSCHRFFFFFGGGGGGAGGEVQTKIGRPIQECEFVKFIQRVTLYSLECCKCFYRKLNLK